MTRLTGWLLALAIPGGCFVLAFHLLRRYLQRDAPDPALTITAPTYRYVTHDEELEVRTRERRERANALRRQAARKESGAQELAMNNLREFGARRERS